MGPIVLVFFLALTLGVGFLGSVATTKAIPTWYAGLRKPPWNPPNWLFAPVWTTLYVCMGVSGWLCWNRAGTGPWVWPFAIQLALNLAWSFVFFEFKRLGLALVEIVFLWLAILWTAVVFWPVSPAASLLLVPYLLWVSFATCLNAAIWRLNLE